MRSNRALVFEEYSPRQGIRFITSLIASEWVSFNVISLLRSPLSSIVWRLDVGIIMKNSIEITIILLIAIREKMEIDFVAAVTIHCLGGFLSIIPILNSSSFPQSAPAYILWSRVRDIIKLLIWSAFRQSLESVSFGRAMNNFKGCKLTCRHQEQFVNKLLIKQVGSSVISKILFFFFHRNASFIIIYPTTGMILFIMYTLGQVFAVRQWNRKKEICEDWN